MADQTSERDLALLCRAIDLAESSPLADPNPRVGCVVVDASGRVVGEGYHHGAGTPHAEVEALAAAGDAARGGTAYVSLEPCNHTGRTGPCSLALIDAGVARVVYALADPNPAASGGGDRLRAAGVDADEVPVPAALEVNRTWVFAQAHRRPFVTWKFAATLDGRSAAADGTSRWITGPDARADVHRLRADCGAVIVGTGTALADDPHLTVRRPDGSLLDRQPLRVVVGRRQLPPTAHLLDDQAPTVHLDLTPADVLSELGDRGVHHAWLEGGPTLAASFVRAGLVDEIVAYVAPALLGAGSPAVGDLGVATMAGIHRWNLRDLARVGDDARLTLTRPQEA
ncbi:MAG TPA: bifunctional diaminohydroxyphosphoribosylaminopyrimidine deaminase/5-amino-6-(5-phosphoribosylamino)uracil reductase RibD [Propionibacteriaceae bacterium]|nr:bifunctional diaminohydroxyphosphoribosylaminopyrimidine deaminase/5-amino-6-(5-phosphoribosylamino)uracil reductase RibD [Propionibacteriaceae bacterium]